MKTIVKEWASGNFSNKKPHALDHMFPSEDTNVMYTGGFKERNIEI